MLKKSINQRYEIGDKKLSKVENKFYRTDSFISIKRQVLLRVVALFMVFRYWIAQNKFLRFFILNVINRTKFIEKCYLYLLKNNFTDGAKLRSELDLTAEARIVYQELYAKYSSLKDCKI